jgi:hypothetical protein
MTMSKYRRDDTHFREQISKLADSGLKFPTAPLGRCPAGLPYLPQEQKPKGRLPEFVAGLIAGGIIVAGCWLAFKVLVVLWSVIL